MAIYRDETGNIISRNKTNSGRSEAQKKADKKYHAKTYKNLQISARIADYDLIDNYCKSIELSKAQVIIKAIYYCIENNINLTEYTPNTNTDNISIENDLNKD